MGEYVKYKGEEIKIGTLDMLYYVSYDKYKKALEEGRLSKAPGNLEPEKYMEPKYGSRFRFPFPDEDKLELGDIIGPYDRGIPVTISSDKIPNDGKVGVYYQMELICQKPIFSEMGNRHCLAPVWRDPENGNMYRMEGDGYVREVVQQIVRNNIIKEPLEEKKEFYRTVCTRIMEGYGLESNIIKQLENNQGKFEKKVPAPTKSIRRGRKG